jgi:hypothetical protein
VYEIVVKLKVIESEDITSLKLGEERRKWERSGLWRMLL